MRIGEITWRFSYYVWRGILQKHYLTFHMALWLKKIGLTSKVKKWLVSFHDRELRKYPSDDMLKADRFYKDNGKRISDIMSLLADDMSRDVFRGVIEYRTKRIPLRKDLHTEDDQYFVRDIVRVENGEVFIDGGGYTGDTIRELLRLAKKENVKLKEIIAFEPNETTYHMLEETFGNQKHITLIKKGLSDHEGVLLFKENGNASKITEDTSQATMRIPVINIDALPQWQEVTWIKMDVEGAELSALQGARKTILKNHPKLTICIYHSDEDMLRIIEYVHKLAPEYRLYVRHHSSGINETVCYAIMDSDKMRL